MRLLILLICPLIFSCATTVPKAPQKLDCELMSDVLIANLEHALESTVVLRVTYTDKKNSDISFSFDAGSGFLVMSDSYYVVGASHTIEIEPFLTEEADVSYEAVMYDGTVNQIELIHKADFTLYDPDILIFRLDVPELDLMLLSIAELDTITEDMDVYLLSLHFNPLLKIVPGYLVSTNASLLAEGSLLYLARIDVRPGNSGGPLVNCQSRVVGVASWAKYVDVKSNQYTFTDGYFTPAHYILDIIEKIENN